MKNFLQSMLIVLIMFIVFVAMMMTIGCSTENPLCTDNYCVEGEIYPRGDLDGDFSQIAIDDSVILATLVGVPTPVEVNPQTQNPTPPTQVTLEGATQTTIDAIVSNTLSGGNRFEGTVVEITAVADFVDDDNEWIALETNNSDVVFYVNAYGDDTEGTLKTLFVKGKSYALQLYIQDQEPDNAIVENAIWSYPVDDIIDTTLSNIVSNTLADDKDFEGKVVNITAMVNYVSTTNRAMTLETSDTSIRFWAYAFGDIFEGAFQKTFIKGNSYNLQLYIREQDSEAEIKTIRSYLVKVN